MAEEQTPEERIAEAIRRFESNEPEDDSDLRRKLRESADQHVRIQKCSREHSLRHPNLIK